MKKKNMKVMKNSGAYASGGHAKATVNTYYSCDRIESLRRVALAGFPALVLTFPTDSALVPLASAWAAGALLFGFLGLSIDLQRLISGEA